MQNVRRRLKGIKRAARVKSVPFDVSQLLSRRLTIKQGSNSEFIDLPNLARRVTIKLGNIIQEEVDVRVNAANMHLLHNRDVITATDKTSYGIVQTESGKVTCTGKVAPTCMGDAVATAGGEAVKCKGVICASGPIVDQHKNQYALLLKNACINALNEATNFKATSIAFPPLSSANCDVSTDLVAEVMLSTLCSYACSNPTLLSDVRIVIADKPIFKIFSDAFKRVQKNLEQVHDDTTNIADVIKPPIHQYSHSQGDTLSLLVSASRSPGHVQSVSFNKGNKDETALNDFVVTNEFSDDAHKSSVDPMSTRPDQKPAPDNERLSLQSTCADPLNDGKKRKGILTFIVIIIIIIVSIISSWLCNHHFTKL